MQESRRDYQPTSHDEQAMVDRSIIPASAHHTPGPWFHSCDEGSEYCNVNAVPENGNDGFVVADLSDVDYLTDGQREANARLIAAAPDLLAALEDLWASATDDHDCQWCDDVSWYGEGHGCQFAYIPSLIAKARGQ